MNAIFISCLLYLSPRSAYSSGNVVYRTDWRRNLQITNTMHPDPTYIQSIASTQPSSTMSSTSLSFTSSTTGTSSTDISTSNTETSTTGSSTTASSTTQLSTTGTSSTETSASSSTQSSTTGTSSTSTTGTSTTQSSTSWSSTTTQTISIADEILKSVPKIEIIHEAQKVADSAEVIAESASRSKATPYIIVSIVVLFAVISGFMCFYIRPKKKGYSKTVEGPEEELEDDFKVGEAEDDDFKEHKDKANKKGFEKVVELEDEDDMKQNDDEDEELEMTEPIWSSPMAGELGDPDQQNVLIASQ